MCGISGFIDFNPTSSQTILQSMTNCLVHRGPDAGAYNVFENDAAKIGLGHRRLSIIDLSAAANQPMHFENFCIVYNGEVYNYKEIQAQLQSLGHSFKTHSD